MAVYKEFKVGGGGSPFGFLGPLLILAVFFTILFFVFKGLFGLLNIIAPILLILTLIIDYTVVKDFFIFVWKLLKEDTLIGILALVLIFFGYHILSGYLFVKALLRRTIKRKIDQIENQRNKYDDYEEVKDDEIEFLELPPIQKPKESPTQKSNPYDDMFK